MTFRTDAHRTQATDTTFLEFVVEHPERGLDGDNPSDDYGAIVNRSIQLRDQSIEFPGAFLALTGHSPMRWQTRVFDKMLAGVDEELEIRLPTGLGKTSIIVTWLIALSRQASGFQITLPRRLVYVVNRRTVVDQATEVVNGIRERLLRPHDPQWAEHWEVLLRIRSALCLLSTDDFPLAVSTLRGELADNEEWKVNPAGAAVIVGTVDMIGSRLLFSGYGDGRYRRPQHAGLIGQDSLVVHDEAHLTSPFGRLLRGVRQAQLADSEPRPIRIAELSATLRNEPSRSNVVSLEPDDEEEEPVYLRMNAAKRLHLHQVADRSLTTRIAGLAFEHDKSSARVLVYVRSPRDAQDVAKKLARLTKDTERARVAILTGTVRGYERDRLVQSNEVYRHMLDPRGEPPEKTVYLVSTSAGEVGMDADADHMVCDPATLESLVQRLGRVNRLGRPAVARVDLVWTGNHREPKRKSGYHLAVSHTLELLLGWAADADGPIDVSPKGIASLMDAISPCQREKAFTPVPGTLDLSDILFDGWSLTSVDELPGRPELEAYLHGVEDDDPPTTQVAWRREVELFSQHGIGEDSISEWFRICPVRVVERVTGNTSDVRRELQKLLRTHRKSRQNETADFDVVVLDSHANARRMRVSTALGDANLWRLYHRTLVLPSCIGGLDAGGMLDGTALEPVEQIDVADGPDRCRVFPGEDATSPAGWRERGRVVLRDASEGTDADGPEVSIMLSMPGSALALDSHELSRFDQTLDEHTEAIVAAMEGLGTRAGLSPEILTALIVACRWHDVGKNRIVWQRYALKGEAPEPYAKSNSYLAPRALGGYRHELGSLLDAMRDEEVKRHPERDLILHLIAAHHGHARPHFSSRSFDREAYTTSENREAADEAMQRFGRLQRVFGRWGLAWLEALMRNADMAASQQPGASPYLLHERGAVAI